MMAMGQPAYFKSETKPNNPASGHAKLVNYYPKQNKIHLSQDAELTQNNNTIRGEQLSYDLDTEILSSHPVQGQRTTVILQPKPKKGSIPL
jgi:lipopolysaccharide transport protein LptA